MDNERCLPCIQNAFVFSQLSHEAFVWPRDATFLFDKVVGFLQGPAVLFHGVGYDRGRRAAYTHFTVDQTLGLVLPEKLSVKKSNLGINTVAFKPF